MHFPATHRENTGSPQTQKDSFTQIQETRSQETRGAKVKLNYQEMEEPGLQGDFVCVCSVAAGERRTAIPSPRLLNMVILDLRTFLSELVTTFRDSW
jgi:hypothetical protein